MAQKAMRYLGRINQQEGLRAVAVGHRRRLLLDSGRVFMLLGALILTRRLTAPRPSHSHAELHVLAAFLLWSLGAEFAILSLVAGQFPRLAAAAANLATALRNHLLGGGL